MRVGVHLTRMPSHAGGAFTFEQEVFDSLLDVATESEHRFVVLDVPVGLRRSGLPANVEYAPRPRQPLYGLLRRTRGFDGVIAGADVDVVWNVAPFHAVTDVPFVTTVWDLQHRLQPLFPEVSARGEWRARERGFAVRLRRAAAIIVGTEEGRREVSTFYQVPESRIHVLPHPTPRFALAAAASDPTVPARLGLRETYLVYPAQLWPHKNHANLLLALRQLRDEGVALDLALVGSDQGNGAAIRRLTDQLGLSEQVHLLGFVSSAELVALYRGALCLAYVSLFGPENLPPLEAFALGCPVVASDVSGASEQLGDAALRVDATRPAAIAEAIRRIRDDAGLRSELVARGRRRAERWTGRDFVRGVFAVLDDLAPYVRCWRPRNTP